MSTFYLVMEWDEMQGITGPIMGLFSSPVNALSVIRNYYNNAPLLFHEGEPIESDDIERLINRNALTNDDKGNVHYEPLILEDEFHRAAAIIKLIPDVDLVSF